MYYRDLETDANAKLAHDNSQKANAANRLKQVSAKKSAIRKAKKKD